MATKVTLQLTLAHFSVQSSIVVTSPLAMLLSHFQAHRPCLAWCCHPPAWKDLPLAFLRIEAFSPFGFVGIDNPPVLRTDTQETENLDKAIFS
jgi:hypothetical protein